MPTLSLIVVHSEVTERSHYAYQFTPKHHGAVPGAAQWLPSLSLDEEFHVFNVADRESLCDNRGWLYGMHKVGDELVDLGTWSQQIAEFPAATAGQAWHGYPIWAVNDELAPDNRRGQKMRPDRTVFDKMEAAGMLTKRQRRRLLKGDHS